MKQPPQTIIPHVHGVKGPAEHLAYISQAEAHMLKLMTDGQSNKTPMGPQSFENLYGMATPSEAKSYYSAPSSNNGPTGGLGSSWSGSSGYSTPASYSPSNSGYSTAYKSTPSFSGSNGGHSYSENSAAGNSSPASREASYGGGYGNSGSSTAYKDNSMPYSSSGASSYSKGMNYSSADYRGAGYGSYPSGQGLNAPNSGFSTQLRDALFSAPFAGASNFNKGLNYSSADYKNAGYGQYPSGQAGQTGYSVQNMTPPGALTNGSTQYQDAQYTPPGAPVTNGPRSNLANTLLSMEGYGQNDSGSSIAYKNNQPAQMDHIDPAMGNMPMLPGMSAVSSAMVGSLPGEPEAQQAKAAAQPAAQGMEDTASNYGAYRSPPSYTYSPETGGQFTPINKNLAPGNPGYLVPMQRAMAGVDPALTESMREAALNSGMGVHPTSEYRAKTPANPASLHGRGMATDVSIDGPNGQTLPNYQNGQSFATYEKYAQAVKQAADQNGIGKDLRWGGYFSGPMGKYGAADLMHFDTGGKLGMKMAGGSFANGLTSQQAALIPGAQSTGMGASPTQVAARDLPNVKIASAAGPASVLTGIDTNSPAYADKFKQVGDDNANSWQVKGTNIAKHTLLGKAAFGIAGLMDKANGGLYGNAFSQTKPGQQMASNGFGDHSSGPTMTVPDPQTGKPIEVPAKVNPVTGKKEPWYYPTYQGGSANLPTGLGGYIG